MQPPEQPADDDYHARLRREAERWSPGEKQASGHGNWLSLQTILRHGNRCVTGSDELQWAEGVGREFLIGRIADGHGLTLGCSDGGAERHVMAGGICATFDAFDISPAAVDEARRLAQQHGLPIRYEVADVNRLELAPASYDLVVIVMALHHFERLEFVLDQIARALRPGALLVFNEFVGPTRFQWTDAQLRACNEALVMIPEQLRVGVGGELVTEIVRPDAAELARTDPFEAIRSDEIMALVRERFDLVAERGYGGAVLHPLLSGLAHNFDEAQREHVDLLRRLIAFEQQQMADGLVGSDFTLVVAQAKR